MLSLYQTVVQGYRCLQTKFPAYPGNIFCFLEMLKSIVAILPVREDPIRRQEKLLVKKLFFYYRHI